jgi:hypothetical protein
MHSKHKLVLFIYIAVLALMLLFPPTVIETTSQNFTTNGVTHDSRSASGGFRFIGSIGGNLPGSLYDTNTVAMDLRQLSIQIIIASLIAAAGYAAFKEEKAKH